MHKAQEPESAASGVRNFQQVVQSSADRQRKKTSAQKDMGMNMQETKPGKHRASQVQKGRQKSTNAGRVAVQRQADSAVSQAKLVSAWVQGPCSRLGGPMCQHGR